MFQLITTSSEPKIIGVNNGVYQVEIFTKYLKKNQCYKELINIIETSDIDVFLENQHKIPNFSIEYLQGKLLKKAKVTDLMGFTPNLWGFECIVSQKFVDCLLEYGITKSDCAFFKIDIKNVKENFYLFFVPMIPNEEIYFPESLLYAERDYFKENKRYYQADNYQHYQKIKKEMPFKTFQKVTLDKKYSKQSIINIQGVSYSFFSNDLIKKLKQKGITALDNEIRQVELNFR